MIHELQAITLGKMSNHGQIWKPNQLDIISHRQVQNTLLCFEFLCPVLRP